MKITIINTSDINGGAALAGFAIFNAIGRFTKIEPRIVCGSKFSNYENIATITGRKIRFIDNLVNDLIIKQTIGQSYWLPSKNRILEHRFIKDTDLINIHNAHGNYLAYPVIGKLAKIAPVVISMHDMWYLTGHCGYAFECNRYQSFCHKCPDLNAYPALKHDTAHFHWKKKKKLYKNKNIHFVTSSDWLRKEAESTQLFEGKKIDKIYNPINTEILKTRNKKNVRELLDIPSDKNIICFGAADIGSERKGFPSFIENIDNIFIKENNIYLLLMGKDGQNLLDKLPSWLPFKYFGSIQNPEFRSLVYNASDVFIFPTLAENLPNMILEAMSSGTPCVTFNVGGCREIVHNGITGYLAKPNDFKDFIHGIRLLLKDQNQRTDLSQNSRRFIIENFSYKNCAEKYATLFYAIHKKFHST